MRLAESLKPEYQGLLTPISPKLKTYRIVGFDTEDNTRGTPISFAFHDGKEAFYTTDADEAIDFIYNARETSIFVAHNLEYDLGNLFKHCDFKYIEEMNYASKLLRATLFGTKNFFLNSASFFQGSLKSLGQLVGFPKLEGDPLNPAYNIRDAKIPQLFMSRLQTRLHAMGVNLGMSIGQMAMAVYRKNFLPESIVTFNPPLAVEEAYYGGRVEVFYKGMVKGPIYVSDIRSSYPDVMRNRPFPDTGRMEKSFLRTHEFGVGRFVIDVPKDCYLPPLPHRSEGGRLFFPTGRLEGTWTYHEVRKALSMGCTIEVEEEGFGTNFSCYPYRDFIDHFWEERSVVKKQMEALKKQGAPPDPNLEFESLFIKLVMNNLYGKAAQHKDTTKMTRIRLPDQKLKRENITKECKIGPFYGYTAPRKTAPKTANYLWGVYTTAYARLSLLEKMQAVYATGARLLYCDTDSIMFADGFTPGAGVKALDIGPQLGQMDLETYDLALFRQAKGYLLFKQRSSRIKGHRKEYHIEKVACKGVPTAYALPFLRDGLVSAIRKPMRLKEAVIRLHAEANKGKDKAFFEDIGINVWRDVQKQMNGVYIKRAGNLGPTHPVPVEHIPYLEEHAFVGPKPERPLRRLPVFAPAVKRGEAFLNVQIPPGHFKRTGLKGLADYFESQRLHLLTFEELLELKPSAKWFSGEVEQYKKGKHGPYFLLRLNMLLGENVTRKNFLASLPETFLSLPPEKLVGMHLAVYLKSSYTKGAAANLSVRIREVSRKT